MGFFDNYDIEEEEQQLNNEIQNSALNKINVLFNSEVEKFCDGFNSIIEVKQIYNKTTLCLKECSNDLYLSTYLLKYLNLNFESLYYSNNDEKMIDKVYIFGYNNDPYNKNGMLLDKNLLDNIRNIKDINFSVNEIHLYGIFESIDIISEYIKVLAQVFNINTKQIFIYTTCRVILEDKTNIYLVNALLDNVIIDSDLNCSYIYGFFSSIILNSLQCIDKK